MTTIMSIDLYTICLKNAYKFMAYQREEIREKE
jgi:hypothetical protein